MSGLGMSGLGMSSSILWGSFVIFQTTESYLYVAKFAVFFAHREIFISFEETNILKFWSFFKALFWVQDFSCKKDYLLC
jgi:hypothetical protein